MTHGWEWSKELESMVEGIPSGVLARAAAAYYPGGPPVDVGPDCAYLVRVVSEYDLRAEVFMFRSVDAAEESLQALSEHAAPL